MWFSNPTLPTSTYSSSLAPPTSPPNRSLSLSLLFSISVWLPRKRWKVKPKPRKDKRKTFETDSKDHTFYFTHISCANFSPLQSHCFKKKKKSSNSFQYLSLYFVIKEKKLRLMYFHSLRLDFTILILPKIQKKKDESTLPINNASNWVPIHFPTFCPTN